MTANALNALEIHEKELADAFNRMYGHFPGSAMLLHKSKRIVALNDTAQALGREAGQFCVKIGPPEMHAGCLANQALSTRRAVSKTANFNGQILNIYWLPVSEHPDYYIHFSLVNQEHSV